MPALVLGPILRYVGKDDATVWVETDAPCVVEVLGHADRTFTVEEHHYGLVRIGGMRPGELHPYDVRLDGRPVWPPPDYDFPPPAIRTLGGEGPVQVVFGSCRVALPHRPPYTLSKDKHPEGREFDALFTLSQELLRRPREHWPDQVAFRRDAKVRSAVYQAVCSPFRNALDTHERRMLRLGLSRPGTAVARALARSAGARDPAIRWRITEGPFFDNQVATIQADGRRASMKLEKTVGDPNTDRRTLETVFERRLV
jgi:hypothetical protein